ncbi:hypothetical protein TNIN_126551 [Trichonephila inaurata madagascariensis]|uniref:Uncharacterized protein n=1 Tax=Trichonephila inaurata madagascariensis TaxID=2747483 RepID=A0A8X6XPI2_9ARAC|nr:hypothetical protein TNIN_126551 [Trichonephila inaurata madagascariensis]
MEAYSHSLLSSKSQVLILTQTCFTKILGLFPPGSLEGTNFEMPIASQPIGFPPFQLLYSRFYCKGKNFFYPRSTTLKAPLTFRLGKEDHTALMHIPKT